VRVLVVFAHPDDETLGCGGTMARLVDEGHDVQALLTLRRSDPRGVAHWDAIVRDFHAAADVIGFEPVLCAPLIEERDADAEVRDLHEAVLPYVEWAETVLTHWPGDVHQVHRTVARAVEIATRPFRRRRNVYSFEVPTSTDQSFSPAFAGQMYVAMDEVHAERKVRAMACYSTESAPGRRPEDLRRRLELRGAEIGAEYAEAFAVHRQFL
jgi:LmbE family N-acetylglucosaminyl deacetylase